MGDEVKVRAELNHTYAWKQQDLTKITPAIEKVFIPFAGADCRVSASMKRDGTVAITHRHPSLDSWRSALSSDWDSLDVDIDSSDYSRAARIYFRLRSKEIRVNINTEGNDGASVLQELLAEFERSMAADVGPPEDERSAEPKERVDGAYQLDYPEDVTWLKKLLENIEAWLSSYNFYGSYSLISAPQFRRYPKKYEEWKTDCETNYKDLSECHLSLTGKTRECSFRYYARSGEVTITLGAVDQREIAEFSATLQKQLPIRVLKDTSVASRQGQRRRYFAEEQIDVQWFDKCMDQLMKLVKGESTFQGYFGEAISDDSPTVDSLKFANYKEWYDQIRAKWDNVVWIRCWIYAPGISITLDLDLLRDLVSLELESPAEETVKNIYEAFESTQKVKRIQGNPYRYRRFMRQFKITKWTTATAFAQALRDAVQYVFPGRVPGRRVAIQTSYLTLGDIEEDLQPFTTFEEFCKEVAATPDLNRAHLVLEGPNGVLLGVELDRKEKQLIVRTSVERSKLPKLLLIFENAVEITLDKAQDEGDEKKDKKDKISSPLLLTSAISLICVLVTGSVAVLNSGGGVSSLSHRYSLEIVYPQGKAGEIVELPGPNFRVQWKLTKKNILGETVDLKSNASVEALRDGTPQPQTFNGDQGAAVLQLAPGQYQINVISTIDNSTMNAIRVKVPEPEQKPPAPDKSVKKKSGTG